jgi:hypothetical protein
MTDGIVPIISAMGSESVIRHSTKLPGIIEEQSRPPRGRREEVDDIKQAGMCGMPAGLTT